jgi:hypothetical protein
MLYSTWQIMVKKKMQNTCENLLRAFAGSLYITSRAALELQFRARASKRFSSLSVGAYDYSLNQHFLCSVRKKP